MLPPRFLAASLPVVVAVLICIARVPATRAQCPADCLCDNVTQKFTCRSVNKISSWPDISNLSFVIKTFDVSNNLLTTIPDGSLDSLDIRELTTFNFAGNPFHCDCGLRYFANYLLRVHAGAISSGVYDTPQCARPSHLTGVAIHTLRDSQLICNCSSPCQNGGLCNESTGLCDCADGWLGNACATACPSQTFGKNCNESCDCEKESRACNHTTGECYCSEGWTGIRCDQVCHQGHFGQDCQGVCDCKNSAQCHHVTGACNCTTGWSGKDCSQPCPEGSFGFHCQQLCDCRPGTCDPFNGTCSCPLRFYGSTCKHNCSAAPICLQLNRHDCTLDTPQQTCGNCMDGHVGSTGPGNSYCTDCRSAPHCLLLNRHNCSTVTNTCGQCFSKFLPRNESNNNVECFDPCTDMVKNYNETDVDCGGTWCERCKSGAVCHVDDDCSSSSVCLGIHRLPSGLDYPFLVANNVTCRPDETPTSNLRRQLEASLAWRKNSLASLSQNDSLGQLVEKIKTEFTSQLKVLPEDLSHLHVTSSPQEPGDPVYHLSAQVSSQEVFEKTRSEALQGMYRGDLRGTILLDNEQNELVLNV